MTPASIARENAIPLEMKKDGLQQRQNGDWVLRFTVQASDMDERLTKAAMGTRFMAALVEIGENEEPAVVAPVKTPTAKREKMDWRDMQPAAQAALRCDQPAFRTFLMEEHSFRPRDPNSSDEAADFIRNFFGITSRAELGTKHGLRMLWKQLDDQFQAWKAIEHA